MQDILSESLRKLRKIRVQKTRMIAILLVLSLVVSLDVFWWLRQPGLTLAGDADCGIVEHTHDDSCQGTETPCNLIEHIHDISCYSDDTADVETQLDWQKMFEDYPFTGNLHEDLVGIAKMQVGYSESKLNFKVDQDGVRHGYTRYGAWYGTPYSNWSATFVSFCLHYAGADENQFPINSGATSMAEQWKSLGNYAKAGNYTPLEGDLIFFNDNTVGIVIETLSTSVYIVRGDIEGSVQTSLISMTDSSISGWGQIRKQPSHIDLSDDLSDVSSDVSNDSAKDTSDSSSSTQSSPSADSGPLTMQQSATTYNSSSQEENTKTSPTDLISYLKKTGGTYYITLLDMHDHEVPKDHNGNYTVYSDENYRLTISSSAPNGIENGTYTYQFPSGADIESKSGIFKLENGTVIGEWEISATGLMTLTLDNVNHLSDVIISATVGIAFPSQQEPIDFDGKISVTVVEKQQEEEVLHTQIIKWGEQGHPDNLQVPGKTQKTDPNKIYWTVEIKGHKNSAITGSTLTDKVVKHYWSHDHYYSEEDMQAGITFGTSGITENGTEWNWHKWTVYSGDIGLEWNEDGWSYIMPESITCDICGGTLALGNEGYTYYAEYMSTPVDIDIAGSLEYVNEFSVDNQKVEGWAAHTQTHVDTTITKNGTFISDANGGKFVWEMQATIPGCSPNEKCKYSWSIIDEMRIVDQNNQMIDHIMNDMINATVTANYYGTTITVPSVYNATENDPYAYDVWSWRTDQDQENPVKNIRQMIFYKRCTCTDETCGREDNNCWWSWGVEGYCDCWTETEDTTFTITYETTDMNVIKAYNSQNLSIHNKATFGNGNGDAIDTTAVVPIPNIIEKEWVKATDNYIVKYQITVNESKIVLGDGSPVTIRDEMTKTISFIRGTLVVSAVDVDGNRTVLQEGVDYEYRYNVALGDHGHEGENHAHVLEIDLLHPKPVTYYLDYDTTVVVQSGEDTVPVIKYKNDVSIELWNINITDSTTEKTYTNVTIASKHFGVEIIKKAADTSNALAHAKFGLFDKQGHLIIARETDENGKILFQTDVANGIVLKEHVLYYVQEIEAPPGYQLSNEKHWMVFCDSPDTCDEFDEVVAGTNAIRVPIDEISEFEITNEVLNYNLPATGGMGIYPLMLVSMLFIGIPLVYIFIKKRKRERRGVG